MSSDVFRSEALHEVSLPERDSVAARPRSQLSQTRLPVALGDPLAGPLHAPADEPAPAVDLGPPQAVAGDDVRGEPSPDAPTVQGDNLEAWTVDPAWQARMQRLRQDNDRLRARLEELSART